MYEMRSTLDMSVLHPLFPAWTRRIHLALGGTKTRQILRRTLCGKERGWMLAAVLRDMQSTKLLHPPWGLPLHDAVVFASLWSPSRQDAPLEADEGWSIPLQEPPGTIWGHSCSLIHVSYRGATNVKQLLAVGEKKENNLSQAGHCSVLA